MCGGLNQPLGEVALAPGHGLSPPLRIDFLSSPALIDGAQSGPLVLNHVTTTRTVITVASKSNKYIRSVDKVGVFTAMLWGGCGSAAASRLQPRGPGDQQGKE